MSVDIRDQMREIGEVQRSTRMPVELHELGTVVQGTPAGIPRMNFRGPVVAFGAAMIVLVVVGGIALLFGSVEEAPPADSVTVTTLATPTTIPSDSQEAAVIITRSSGSLGLSVEWTRPDDSALLSWGSPFSPAGLLAYVDGQYVFPLVGGGGEADPYPFAFSSDGSEWVVGSLLPDSEISSIPFNSHPLATSNHGNLQVVEFGIDWPAADGSLPEAAHYAFHDGEQWHQRSYPIDFAIEASGNEPGTYDQYWMCSSDGIGEMISYTVAGRSGQGTLSEGYLLVTDAGAAQVTNLPNSQIACLPNGIFGVSGVDVYRLVDSQWELAAALPVGTVESGWMPTNSSYMFRSSGQLHMTSDFASWQSHTLPEELGALPEQRIVQRNGLWLVVEGGFVWEWIPPGGTWISEDLTEWEFLPSPDFTGVDSSDVRAGQVSVSPPVEGLFVAVHHESEPVAPIWIGRIGP